MKTTELKNLLKTAVREVFQEEMKELLLEMVKSQNRTPIVENTQPIQQPTVENPSNNSPVDVRHLYMEALGQTAAPPKQQLQITSTDTISEGSKLPDGEVGMDLIAGLMKGNG